MPTHKELLTRHVTDPCAPILYRSITPARAISSVHHRHHHHHVIHPSHSHSLLVCSYLEGSDPNLSARTQSQQTSSRAEKFPTPFPSSSPPLRHGRRGGRQAARAPALSRDDPGGHRGAERQERVEQVRHLQVHRGQVRRPPQDARVAAGGASVAHEGDRRAPLPQEQLLPHRRAGRPAEAWPGSPAQAHGPQRAAAAAQAHLSAPPRPPGQAQGPRGRSRQPAQEGQDLFRPCRRRIHPRQARPRPSPQGTPRRAGGGLSLLRPPPGRGCWFVGSPGRWLILFCSA